MVKSVTWFYGTSGVGKTSLINTLQDKYGFLPYKCSAFDAVQTVPELLVDGKTDYTRMTNDFEYALAVQSAIGSFFLDRTRRLVSGVLNGDFEEEHIAVERSLYDPITYMIVYLDLYKSNPHSSLPSDVTLRTYSELMVRLNRAMSDARIDLNDFGVRTSVTHIPINPDYPYDMAGGIRPSKVVRDRFEAVTKGIIAGGNTCYLPKAIHKLKVGHVVEYAETVYQDVTRKLP